MNRLDRLNQLLRAAFPQATHMQIFDDSADHAGHAHGQEGETHYRLRIVDPAFHNLRALEIHRKILAAVKPETDTGLHSFVIESATAH